MSTALRRVLHATCPLCEAPRSVYRRWVTFGALLFAEHRGSHPQSVRCYWSDREVPVDLPVEKAERVQK